MSHIVAIDGPAGAGKSTVARRVAVSLGFAFVDTGAIYRTVALAALKEQIELHDGGALAAMTTRLKMHFETKQDGNLVFLEGEDVTAKIRSREVSTAASEVSKHSALRANLLDTQRMLASQGAGAVLEGRDIGTVVFPNAQTKIFLDASEHERATRRAAELRGKGESVDFEELLQEIRERDERDRSRDVAPLKPAEDAEIIDTTGLSIDDVVHRIVSVAKRG
ncbi:MAG: (d)CMP kinase [Myxococcota bacterium]|nr:(d)CMP kinase [Myxococcota bacterium]